MKTQQSLCSLSNLEILNTAWGVIISDFILHNRSLAKINKNKQTNKKPEWHKYKSRHIYQWNGIEVSGRSSCTCSYVIFDKADKNICCRKHNIFTKWWRENWLVNIKKWKGNLSLSTGNLSFSSVHNACGSEISMLVSKL